MTRLFAVVAAVMLAVPALADLPVHKVGKVTWHPLGYVGKTIALRGYLLQRDDGYILFSDEPGGKVSVHDLPVTGTGIETLKDHQLYLLHGRFVMGGLAAANGSPYHLELSEPPSALTR
jgi:hypothetical protein